MLRTNSIPVWANLRLGRIWCFVPVVATLAAVVFFAFVVAALLLTPPITDHEYPLTVWTAGEAVQEQVQRSTAKLQPGISAVYMGMYASVIQMRAAVEAGPGVVVENRPLQVEFQQTLYLCAAQRAWGHKCSLVRQVAIISPPAMQLRILHKSAIYVGRSVLRGGWLSIAANAVFSPSAAAAIWLAGAWATLYSVRQVW